MFIFAAKLIVIMRKGWLLLICSFIVSWSYAQDPYGKEGMPAGDLTPKVNINGVLYKLYKTTHTARIANGNTWDGELNIPEEVAYEGDTYTVDKIEWIAFNDCTTLTKVRIPKTITEIWIYPWLYDCKNPFAGCTSLECIDVDEDNPIMCSVNGVLFSKDKTHLYCYPAGAHDEAYIVPDCVTWIGVDAFAYNPHLVKVTMPNSVTYISGGIFEGCI